MRKITKFSLAIVGLSLMIPAFAAKDPNLKLIKARQGEMQLKSFNAGPLFGMAKGKIEYNAEMASMLANNLLLQTKMDLGSIEAASSIFSASGVNIYPDSLRSKIRQLRFS